MIKRKQLFRHRPDEGAIGDCHRTAIACLLDLEPEHVPHYGEFYFNDPDGERFNKAFEDWLSAHELRTVAVTYGGESLTNVLASIGAQNKGAYYLLGGTSRTGVNHTVICCGCEIEHDPSIDDVGIVGPCDDGYYWVTFLVPNFMYSKPTDEIIANQPEAESLACSQSA